MVVVVLGLGLGYVLFNNHGQTNTEIKNIQSLVSQRHNDIQQFKADVNRELDALALQIGGLYAQSMRINALGERLTDVAQLDESEFDFTTEPGIGGAGLELTNKENTPEDLFASLYSIKANFEQQEEQFGIICATRKRSRPQQQPRQTRNEQFQPGKEQISVTVQ